MLEAQTDETVNSTPSTAPNKDKKNEEVEIRKYEDSDIHDLINVFIEKKLGGYEDECTYLLKEKFIDEDNNEYYVLYAFPIDTAGKALPLDFHLRKSHPSIGEGDPNYNPTDVFEEIMPFAISQESINIKILFPYNQLQYHWLTGEIKIFKQGSNYQVTIYTHDPFGSGKMSDGNFNIITQAIKDRIKEFDSNANFTINNIESPYQRRQAIGDGKSCGVIETRDCIKRIKGKSLNKANPYENGAKKLREKYVNFVSAHCGNDHSFVIRNRKKIDEKHNQKNKNTSQNTINKQIESDVLKIISNIKNKELQKSIMDAISNKALFNEDFVAYYVTVKSALEDRPIELFSQGIVLEDTDVSAFNKLCKILSTDVGQLILSTGSLISLFQKSDDIIFQIAQMESAVSSDSQQHYRLPDKAKINSPKNSESCLENLHNPVCLLTNPPNDPNKRVYLGCEFLLMSSPPTLNSLPIICSTAFILVGNKIFYVNQLKNKCTLLKTLDEKTILYFHQELNIQSLLLDEPIMLNEKELEYITSLIGVDFCFERIENAEKIVSILLNEYFISEKKAEIIIKIYYYIDSIFYRDETFDHMSFSHWNEEPIKKRFAKQIEKNLKNLDTEHEAENMQLLQLYLELSLAEGWYPELQSIDKNIQNLITQNKFPNYQNELLMYAKLPKIAVLMIQLNIPRYQLKLLFRECKELNLFETRLEIILFELLAITKKNSEQNYIKRMAIQFKQNTITFNRAATDSYSLKFRQTIGKLYLLSLNDPDRKIWDIISYNGIFRNLIQFERDSPDEVKCLLGIYKDVDFKTQKAICRELANKKSIASLLNYLPILMKISKIHQDATLPFSEIYFTEGVNTQWANSCQGIGYLIISYGDEWVRNVSQITSQTS